MSTRRPWVAWIALVGVMGVIGACSPVTLGSPTSFDPSSAASPTPDPTPTPAPTPTPEPLIPDDALLPNLVMEPLGEWQVEFVDGRRRLRVTTIFSNYGVGPFELQGERLGTDDEAMSIDQVISTASGRSLRIPTSVAGTYAGDGHEHWHAERAVTMELSNVLEPGTVRFGSKISFCFFDNSRTNSELPDAASESYYLFRWCGEPEDLTVRMGLSIGWGDRYGWDFVGQYIDITGMAGGTYTLRATVDWSDNFSETDDTDNCTMSRIQIPAAGVGQIIVVEAAELPCPT